MWTKPAFFHWTSPLTTLNSSFKIFIDPFISECLYACMYVHVYVVVPHQWRGQKSASCVPKKIFPHCFWKRIPHPHRDLALIEEARLSDHHSKGSSRPPSPLQHCHCKQAAPCLSFPWILGITEGTYLLSYVCSSHVGIFKHTHYFYHS